MIHAHIQTAPYRAILLTSLTALLLAAPPAIAQHSDVEFSYVNNKIEIVFGLEGRIFEGDMPTSGGLAGFANEPGFASEVSEGLGINPNDLISYQVVGGLLYHDGGGFASTPETIAGDDAPNFGTVIISQSTTAGDGLGGVIGQAGGSGDFHADPGWQLSVPAATGAYGIALAVSTDEPGIADSDSFYIVFNFGLDDPNFESTVEDFAYAIDPIDGDVNFDGSVDIADLALVGSQWGTAGNGPFSADIAPDPYGDGNVDVADLATVGSHWGNTSTTSLAAGVSIPTPAAFPFALTALAHLACRRRRNTNVI